MIDALPPLTENTFWKLIAVRLSCDVRHSTLGRFSDLAQPSRNVLDYTAKAAVISGSEHAT